MKHNAQEKYENKNNHLIGTIYHNILTAQSLKYSQHRLMMKRKFIEIEQDNNDGKNYYSNIALLLSTIGMIYYAL